MATQIAQYPNALRECIKHAGYSFREVSKETNIPESTLYDWAAGNRPIPHQSREVLAQLLGCEVSTLAPASTGYLVQYKDQHRFTDFGRNAMDRLRRCLLRYAPTLTSTVLLSPLSVPNAYEQERVSRVIVEPSRIDTSTLTAFESMSSTYWQMYRHRVLPNDHLMFDYALAHLQKVLHVGSASLPQAHEQRLCEIIADAAHLVGYVAWDLNYRDVTDAAYALALQAASESGSPIAHAFVLGDRTFASLFSGKSHEALPLITQARQLVTADAAPVLLRAWIASVAAELEASLHGETAGLWDSAALHDLETAEHVISTCTPDENDTSHLRTGFDVVRLTGYKGTCYLHLRRAEEARAAFTQSLALLSPTRMISKAMDLTKLAEAHRQLGSAQMACTLAIEALSIAQQIGSRIILQEVQTLRQRFSPTAEVRDLDERLTLFAVGSSF